MLYEVITTSVPTAIPPPARFMPSGAYSLVEPGWCARAHASGTGPVAATATVTRPVRPSDVAITVVTPGALPVTVTVVPDPLTVATDGSLLVHVTDVITSYSIHYTKLYEDTLRAESPACAYVAHAADLTQPDALADVIARHGASGQRALVVTEGLLVYLRPEEVARLAATLATAPSFRWWLSYNFV